MNEISTGDEEKIDINYFNVNWRLIVKKNRQNDWKTSKLNFQNFPIYFSRNVVPASTIFGKIGKVSSYEDCWRTIGCLEAFLGVFPCKSSRGYSQEPKDLKKGEKKVKLTTFFNVFFFLVETSGIRLHSKFFSDAVKASKTEQWEPGGWDCVS